MLRFRLHGHFRFDAADAPDWAYVIGKECLTIPGHVVCADGEIRVRKSVSDPAGLAVCADLGDAGRLTMQTCLLPDRDAPYDLGVELVRHRVMLILTKLEDWNLTDLPADHPIMQELDEVRELFTKALIGTSTEREDPAYEALRRAVRLSESIVRLHAERQLRTRMKAIGDKTRKATVTTPQIGCLTPPDQFSEHLTRSFRDAFDFLGAPVSWNVIEPEEGKFSFVSTDKWIAWAVQEASLPIVAGPVLDFAGRSVPSWLHIWEHDYDSVREFAFEHARRVVTRYRKAVTRWLPLSGINTNEIFSFSPEQMVDMTRLAVLLTRKIHQNARITIDIDQPFGEHVTHNHKGVSPLLYLQMVIESGVPFDSIGLRLQFGDSCPGHPSRDLMQIAALLDTYAQFEKTIHITAFGVPSSPPNPNEPSDSNWNEEAQAEWLADIATLALSKPYVQSVCWQSLYDTHTIVELRHAGLFRADGTPKSASKRAAEFRAAIKDRRLPATITPAPEVQAT